MRGYKITHADMTCRGFQFELNKEFEIEGELTICLNGFHFCLKPENCFNYYDYTPGATWRYWEVEALGEIETDKDKSCTSKIKFIREILHDEMMTLINSGEGNNGIYNTGHNNTGNGNAGSNNIGDWNLANYNQGSFNTGHENIGDYNTGYRNKGNYNAGNNNIGNYNIGNGNEGEKNIGNNNIGNQNIGSFNHGNYQIGCFNTEDNDPIVNLFDKPSGIKLSEWNKHIVKYIIDYYGSNLNSFFSYYFNTTAKHFNFWINDTINHLKIDDKDIDKTIVQFFIEQLEALPNYDANKFEQVTGIDLNSYKEKI